MALTSTIAPKNRKWTLLAALSLAAFLAASPQAFAKDVGGELVVMNWMSGSDLSLVRDLETASRPPTPTSNSGRSVSQCREMRVERFALR
jgi:hypothetical protein